MPNVLSSLSILLGLDASEYTRGLTKAEKDAQKFAQNTRAAILEVGKVLGGLAIGKQLIDSFKEIVSQAEALNDLADATGSSVESLSRLSNQAKIAGADFATLETAVLKLSQGMAGADDESSKTKEALKILGITTRDPVEALQQAAVKLNTYADGVNKVGLSVALFGRQGAQFTSVLKDIAESQNVNATITKKQADEAENLAKQFRALSVEAEGFKNLVLNAIVPALSEMIAEFRSGINAAGGFWDALRLGANLSPFDDTIDGISKLRAEIARLQQLKATGGDSILGNLFKPGGLNNLQVDRQLADAEKQLKILEARFARTFGVSNAKNADRQFAKPEAPNPPGGNAKALKEVRLESDALLASLLKRQQATLDLDEVETALVDIYNIEAKGLEKLSAAKRADILDSAEQIRDARLRKEAEREAAKLAEEEARIRDRNSQLLTRQIETEQAAAAQVRDQNEGLKENLIALRDGEDALLAYREAKLLKAAAELEDKAAMIENTSGISAQTIAIREHAAAIRNQVKIITDTDIAKKVADDLKAIKDVESQAFDVVGNAIEDLIVNGAKASDVVKKLEKDLVAFLTRQALLGIKNAAGLGSGGTDLFSILAKLLTGGGSTGIANIGAGGSGGLAFQATGTDFARGGPTIVGENGPELLDLPPGARVTPNHRLRAGGTVIHQVVNVLPGASTASIKQAKAAARDAILEAMRER